MRIIVLSSDVCSSDLNSGNESFAYVHAARKGAAPIDDQYFAVAAQVGIRHAHAQRVGHEQCRWNAKFAQQPDDGRAGILRTDSVDQRSEERRVGKESVST